MLELLHGGGRLRHVDRKGRDMWRRTKLRWFLVSAMTLAGVAIALVIWQRQPVGFDTLENLVVELAGIIEERDEGRLSRLSHDPIEVPFERLVRQHAKLNYVSLLHENRLWMSSNSWKLGGHGSRFGHIHIDCVRQLDGQWYLKRIWHCR